MSSTLLKLETKLAVSVYSPIPYQLTDRCGESSDNGLVNVDRYANLFSPLRFHPNCQAVLAAEDTIGFLLERVHRSDLEAVSASVMPVSSQITFTILMIIQ